MSNPRRFGKTILYRVTERMTLAKAKKKAKQLRVSGLRARVDTYQSAHAVWSVKREVANPSEERVKIKTKGMITLYHGATSSSFLKINKSKVVLGWWTTNIHKAAIYAIAMHTKENFEMSKKHPTISFSSGYPIILICRVPAEWFWEAHGDQSQLSQPNMPRQTLSIKYIIGCYHYKNYKVLDSVDEEFEFIKSHWIRNKSLKENRSYIPKGKKKSRPKMITIYHGTGSKYLSKIRASKKVIGYWTTGIFNASTYALLFVSESIPEIGYPTILVAKVPEDDIIWEYSKHEAHIIGFKWKDGYIKNPKITHHHGLGTEQTAQLFISKVQYVLHYKNRSEITYEDWVKYTNSNFNRSDWIRRKL